MDVDIDSLDALKFVSWFLPKTNCIFGHESKPRSHWIYRVPAAKAVEQFIANRRMILEIRGNNRCTVFPGSFHPSGEKIEFENPDNYEPSTSTWKQLKRAASKIAIATELSKVWSPGTRHELTLCTAAKLARLGWTITETSDLIRAIATEANDEELHDRLTAVESTFAAYDEGREISGEERFIQLVGAHTAENIRRWACSPDNLKQLMKPKKALSQSESEKPIPTILTDLSNDSGAADAFATAFKDDLIYCNKEWFRRKNQVFEPVSAEIVQGLAKDFFQNQVGNLSLGAAVLSPLKSCLGLGIAPAMLSLGMVLTYSIVLGIVYMALEPGSD